VAMRGWLVIAATIAVVCRAAEEEDPLDSLIKFSPLAQQWFQDYTAMEMEWNPYGNWKLNMSECSGHGLMMYGNCMCDDNCYSGSDCAVSCAGHGQCYYGLCQCDDGWNNKDYTGKTLGNCSFECCNGDCERECNGHGDCKEGKCACWDGQAGRKNEGWSDSDYGRAKYPSCEVECCNKDCAVECSGHGMCNKSLCHCQPGWSSSDYSRPLKAGEVPDCRFECCNGDCTHECGPKKVPFVSNGRCTNGKCVCKAGWSNKDYGRKFFGDCSVKCCNGDCSKECSNHGVCKDGSCTCDIGWSGEKCDVECSHHGTYYTDHCVCDLGWYGQNCTQEMEAPGNLNCSCYAADVGQGYPSAPNCTCAPTGGEFNMVSGDPTIGAPHGILTPEDNDIPAEDETEADLDAKPLRKEGVAPYTLTRGSRPSAPPQPVVPRIQLPDSSD